MTKIEAVILGMFFGLLPVIFCLLTGLVVMDTIVGPGAFEPWILWSAAAGVIIDVIFLRRWVRGVYRMSTKVLALIYLFYSVVAAGLGMGVPILNFGLAVAAGVYAARRAQFSSGHEQDRNRAFKKTAAFSAAVIALMCCLIALWGAVGGMIGSTFETPCLSFTFTVPVYFAVALTGGAVLVLLHYWLTRTAAVVTFRGLSRRPVRASRQSRRERSRRWRKRI